MTGARHIGSAHFQGRLYDNDGYPGVVDSLAPEEKVLGDVFEIPTDPAFLARLDAFEGCGPEDPQPHEYRRVIRPAATGKGVLQTWIYLYNWPLDGKRRIESGDFLTETGVELRKRVVR